MNLKCDKCFNIAFPFSRAVVRHLKKNSLGAFKSSIPHPHAKHQSSKSYVHHAPPSPISLRFPHSAREPTTTQALQAFQALEPLLHDPILLAITPLQNLTAMAHN